MAPIIKAASPSSDGVNSPPTYPLEGVVSWNMNTTCNYRCSYCTQRFLDDRKAWARDLPKFIEGFLALPGDWEIKLSGGEPTLHPSFETLCGSLSAGGRRLSMVTNLSAPLSRYQRFFETTEKKPGILSASYHPEYTALDPFLEKLSALAQLRSSHVHATVVATQSRLPELPALRSRFQNLGLELRIQPEKQDREVIDYSPAEIAQLHSLGGHNGTGLISPDFSGRMCWAGARYLIVDHKGNAWRCYPARKSRSEYLGNLLEGSLLLSAEPRLCRYSACTCSVPAQRGMVRNEANATTEVTRAKVGATLRQPPAAPTPLPPPRFGSTP